MSETAMNYEDLISHDILHRYFYCICCLEHNGPFVKISKCMHTGFLRTFPMPDFNPPIPKVVCLSCHSLLKKIHDFKIQTQESYNTLLKKADQKTKLDHKLKLTLSKVKHIDKFEIESIPEKEPIKISPKEKPNMAYNKTKNIETALNIINTNANTLQSLVSNNLKNITDTILTIANTQLNLEPINVMLPETEKLPSENKVFVHTEKQVLPDPKIDIGESKNNIVTDETVSENAKEVLKLNGKPITYNVNTNTNEIEPNKEAVIEIDPLNNKIVLRVVKMASEINIFVHTKKRVLPDPKNDTGESILAECKINIDENLVNNEIGNEQAIEVFKFEENPTTDNVNNDKMNCELDSNIEMDTVLIKTESIDDEITENNTEIETSREVAIKAENIEIIPNDIKSENEEDVVISEVYGSNVLSADFKIEPDDTEMENIKCDMATNSSIKGRLRPLSTPKRLDHYQLEEERRKRLRSREFLRWPYKCKGCIIGFNYKENYDEHNKRKHEMRPGCVACKICKQVVEESEIVDHTNQHYNSYMSRRVLQCTVTTESLDECIQTDRLQAKISKRNAEIRKIHYEPQKLKKRKTKKQAKSSKQRNKEYYARRKKLLTLTTFNRH